MALQHLGKKIEASTMLTTVLILLVVVTLVVTAGLAISTDTSVAGQDVVEGKQANQYAHSCVEIAIEKLKLDTNYTGSENIVFDKGNCDILLVNGSGNNDRTVQAIGYSNGKTRRVQVEIQEVVPDLVVTSWEEVID